MDEAYRTKLAHWGVTMVSLHLFVTVWMAYRWFWQVMPRLADDPDRAIDAIYTTISETGAYLLLGFLILAWHFADFLQFRRPASPMLARLCSFRVWIAACWIFAVMNLWVASPFLDDLFCTTSPGTLYFAAAEVPTANFGYLDGCGAWTPPWKTMLVLLSFFLCMALSAAKIVLSLASQFRRFRRAT